ncbi:hypothetical protein SAMN05444586_10153 [Acinetobacter bohemicus]|uniref:Uncharacterized protein n=1 Tax=Acinetobacter bohemicus TaxID=1435036 RepID=A0A1I6U821_9GAMM|nr:hypothetical protein SAMN05444586_10153 [Acinetobacter bohemicus]
MHSMVFQLIDKSLELDLIFFQIENAHFYK